MSKVRTTIYGEETETGFNLRTATEEASRCLLCHDAPCSKGCPADTDPAKFIRSIRFRNIKGAAETIRENNVLGGCCARVCPYDKLCEEACSRTGIDKPIAIGKLQRFAIEQEKELGMEILKAPSAKLSKVACIGGGPASLACAAKLQTEGYEVTIFEAFEKVGGVLTYGITPSRLPQSVVDHDIDMVKKLGVKFVMNHAIDGKDAVDKLKKDGFDAVFVGAGLWKTKKPDIPGADLEGVVSALDYLKCARSLSGTCGSDETVLVIGGGDVAMDCATTAKQLGAKSIAIVYRRTVEEAPANISEVAYVQSMGIPIITKFRPASIVGDSGKVTAMIFDGTDGESTLKMKADKVVFAIGQAPADDMKELAEKDGVFAGGDISNGGKSVVQAVADGKAAAEEIIKYLSKKGEVK